MIEQVPAAAHNGAAGNHIVVNEDGKQAFATLENWASPMALGELRAIGFWWKLVAPVPSGFGTVIAVMGIDAELAAVLVLDGDNAVTLTTTHDGGWNQTSPVPLFSGTEWRHLRFVTVRHDTAGGAQLWDGNNLLIDDTEYDTTDWYDGTPDWFYVGACATAAAGLEMYQDEFYVGTTLADARAGGVGARKLVGVGR